MAVGSCADGSGWSDGSGSFKCTGCDRNVLLNRERFAAALDGLFAAGLSDIDMSALPF